MSDVSDGLAVLESSLRRMADSVKELREEVSPDSSAPQTPGELLMLARNQKGLSQKKLAEEAGVHINTIVGFENGHTNPRPRTLMALAEKVGLPWEVLKEDEDDEATD